MCVTLGETALHTESISQSGVAPALKARFSQEMTECHEGAQQTETLQDKLENIVADMCVELGTGLTEAIYRNAMAAALQKVCHPVFVVATEVTVPVVYKKQTVGALRADICLNQMHPPGVGVVIELKVASKITEAHIDQCRAYMRRVTPGCIGFVINFGVPYGELHAIGTLLPDKKRKREAVEVSYEADEQESRSPTPERDASDLYVDRDRGE